MLEIRRLPEAKLLVGCSVLRRATLLDCTAVFSALILRLDNRAVGNIMETLNKKVLSVCVNIVITQFITESDIGIRGLHLHNKASS